MTPDHRAVQAHLDSARFQAAVAAGRWRVVDSDWPALVVAVAAAPRPGGPEEIALRMDLTGYPQQAPTAEPWDLEAGARLAERRRPRGEGVEVVFRTNWEHGRALYAPFDRVALTGHPDWPRQYPGDTWTPDRDLTFFLGKVHTMLNDDDYLGAA
ncbi:DUF7665 family protein [Lentzea albidocapillata]|uniref:Uncharacterized protein n=1 Tax=Lentzea albidocapillata TaxID=40571 RepID=A0A1W2FRS6_9PSEU|nr:hypothetical protein [Lentzea albidocapillata]SMD24620.1 hypothetical protein SAMN05660733_07765 [Lentzea albidocapillata]